MRGVVWRVEEISRAVCHVGGKEGAAATGKKKKSDIRQTRRAPNAKQSNKQRMHTHTHERSRPSVAQSHFHPDAHLSDSPHLPLPPNSHRRRVSDLRSTCPSPSPRHRVSCAKHGTERPAARKPGQDGQPSRHSLPPCPTDCCKGGNRVAGGRAVWGAQKNATSCARGQTFPFQRTMGTPASRAALPTGFLQACGAPLDKAEH